jgi:predicted kinase
MKSLSLSQPHAILLVGIPGSGKSLFAQKFAETFNAPCVTDSLIISLTGNLDAAKKITEAQLDEILKTNQSFVYDGDLNDKADRIEMSKKLKKAGYQPFLIWVQTDIDTAKSRSFKHHKERTESDYNMLAKRFVPPQPSEKALVISGKHTYATQAKIVLKKLTFERASISFHPTPPTRSLIDIRSNR